ncbi:MAG: SDR family oxidoreductase [Pseudomonadales bacterium]|nr:SDR family oxidoreductase [Pseudomonadales bacterium]
MTNHVAGKVIVVTGAASGFGRLVAEKAVARGARVVGGDLDEQGLAETLAAVSDSAAMAVLRTDVTKLEDVQALVALAVERFGAIDVMVNNAGTMPLAFFSDHETAMGAWNRCIDVNFRGVLNGMVAAHDPMLAAGRGQIVNLSSIYGNFPTIGGAVYGATKAAVDFLSESFRQEARGRIKVTVVKPTGVPATNLAGGVENPEAPIGIWGHFAAADLPRYEAMAAGQLPARELDPESIEYFVLAPEYIANAILHVIDQPWGVSIGSITVRASGDGYVL